MRTCRSGAFFFSKPYEPGELVRDGPVAGKLGCQDGGQIHVVQLRRWNLP